MHRRVLSFLLAGLWFTSVAAQQPLSETAPLGTGDVVRVTVYGQPDLSTVTRVDDGGSITFPLLGEVTVRGLSTADTASRLSSLLGERGIVRNAQVNVFMEERGQVVTKTVTILGQVSRSGKFPLEDAGVDGAATLVDLLAMAGGTTANAADYLYLIRGSGPQATRLRVDLVRLLQQGELALNAPLAEGDVVLIPEMDVFFIYGAVKSPGRYRLARDMTVMQALSIAGGVTELGTQNRIVVNRRVDDRIESSSVQPGSQLNAGDVLYVEERRF